MDLTAPRLFFALWPDDALRAALAALPQRLPPVKGRPVKTVNLHLTLVFLGAVSKSTRACLEAQASRLRLPGFTLRLNRWGHFRRSQTWWVGSDAVPRGLTMLVRTLREAVRRCDIDVETSPYRPHVTCYRQVPRPPARSARSEPDLLWTVRAFVLAESVNAPDGVCYRVLREWDLPGKNPA